MQVLLLNSPDSAPAQSKLEELDVNFRRFDARSVHDLTHDTSTHIYVLPHQVCQSPEWQQLRARLSQANRYYIVIGGGLQTGEIITAARDGAFDVLSLADPEPRWRDALEKVVQSQKLWLQLYGGNQLASPDALLGQSPAMKSLRQAIERLGPTVASVLILGESGVGKERVANALHQASVRGPFIAVNCAAIPKELMESELFGAEKGAYTGAVKTRAGLVEQAAGGTLFLDEIGELEVKLQPKLLRFLETKRFRRVGGQAELLSEVRVISATNSHLEAEVAANKFRSDLYYRLSEVILHIPPLRARLEDIPQFAMAFLQAAGERMGKFFDSVEPDLIRKFQQHDWPGNVRELRNSIDRMVILYDGPVLRASWWDPPQPQSAPASSEPANPVASIPGLTSNLGMPLNRKQKLELARKLLESSSNDLTWVAAQLGIHPTTLYRWRKAQKL